MKKDKNKSSHFIIWLIVIVMACTALVGMVGWVSNGFSNLNPMTWFPPEIIEPDEPTDPTDPVEPVDPIDPVDPTEPTEPTEPTYSFLINDGLIISYSGTEKDVIIPDSIDGQQVERIGSAVFANNKYLENVILPNYIREIDAYAFKNCTSLKSVTFPMNLYYIGQGAFENCVLLRSVCFYEGFFDFLNIEEGAFKNCSSLEKVYFPSNVYITCKNYLFENTGSLIIFYQGNIDEFNTFVYCYGAWLEGANFTHLYECSESLFEEIEVTSYLDFEIIEDNGSCYISAYNGNLKNIIIPDVINNYTVIGIGVNAFSGMDIESVIFPSSVSDIMEYAFYNCNSLRKVYFSKNAMITFHPYSFSTNDYTGSQLIAFFTTDYYEDYISNVIYLENWDYFSSIDVFYECTLEQFLWW